MKKRFTTPEYIPAGRCDTLHRSDGCAGSISACHGAITTFACCCTVIPYHIAPYVIAQFFQPRVLTAIVAVYGGVLVGKLVGLQSTS